MVKTMITHVKKENTEKYLKSIERVMESSLEPLESDEIFTPVDIPLSVMWNEKMKEFMKYQSIPLTTNTLDFFDMTASGIRQLELENSYLQSKIEGMRHDYKLAKHFAEAQKMTLLHAAKLNKLPKEESNDKE